MCIRDRSQGSSQAPPDCCLQRARCDDRVGPLGKTTVHQTPMLASPECPRRQSGRRAEVAVPK
eukprot:6547652-Alexandrium_andersonii.AAC.1